MALTNGTSAIPVLSNNCTVQLNGSFTVRSVLSANVQYAECRRSQILLPRLALAPLGTMRSSRASGPSGNMNLHAPTPMTVLVTGMSSLQSLLRAHFRDCFLSLLL